MLCGTGRYLLVLVVGGFTDLAVPAFGADSGHHLKQAGRGGSDNSWELSRKRCTIQLISHYYNSRLSWKICRFRQSWLAYRPQPRDKNTLSSSRMNKGVQTLPSGFNCGIIDSRTFLSLGQPIGYLLNLGQKRMVSSKEGSLSTRRGLIEKRWVQHHLPLHEEPFIFLTIELQFFLINKKSEKQRLQLKIQSQKIPDTSILYPDPPTHHYIHSLFQP